MEGALRLDTDLWTPSSLGLVGPGELGHLANGGDALYRPLLVHHRDRPGLPDDAEPWIELVTDDEAWDRLHAEPEVTLAMAGHPSRLRHVDDAVVVAVRRQGGHGLLAVLAVRPQRADPRVGELVLSWTPSGVWPTEHGPQRMVAAGWLALFQAAAAHGLVGLVVTVTDTGARKVRTLQEQAGFRPVADRYAEVGLSTADAHLDIDRWSLVVTGDEVTDLRLRHATDDAARTELLTLLARLFGTIRRDEADVVPAHRTFRFSGPVTFDGCHGWSVESWDDGERVPFGAAESRIGRWARDQLA